MDVLAAGALTVLALLPRLGFVPWLCTRQSEPEDAQAYAIGAGAIAFGAILATTVRAWFDLDVSVGLVAGLAAAGGLAAVRGELGRLHTQWAIMRDDSDLGG